jgi:gamma-glutamylputrescine oxidase
VIGAGIAGSSAALHLAERGYQVVQLESDALGHGASGRNGGQALVGLAVGQDSLTGLLGTADARAAWDLTVEGLRLLHDLCARHAIDCDWIPGHLLLGLRPRHDDELRQTQRQLQSLGYHGTLLLNRSQLRDQVASQRYRSGLLDPHSGHLQPLKYLRGLSRAAVSAGVVLHEHSRALSWSQTGDGGVIVHTAGGQVHCRQLLLAGNATLGAVAPSLARRILGVGTYMVATEVLGAERAAALLPGNAAAADMNWVLDYFRRSSDHRLLFGGRVSYAGLNADDSARATLRRMLAVFPQLQGVRIEHAWGGWLDITRNRAPDFGRLSPAVWYLQGFSGHGLVLAGMAGKLAAEAMAGSSERFDVFARIKHRAFPGGAALRRPALVLAMLWYRLRDLL